MVQRVVYSRDGTRLTSTGEDGTVRTWDTASGHLVRAFQAHPAWTNGLAYSPDQTHLATGGGDGLIRVWEVATGKESLVIKAHKGAVNSVVYSHDGARLASASSDGTVRTFDAASGAELRVYNGPGRRLVDVAYSPSRRHLAWSGDAGLVQVWDLVRDVEVRTFRTPVPRMRLAYSPNGALLAIGDRDGNIALVDMAGERPLRQVKGHTNDVNHVAFSPDGARLASAGDDGTVRLWDAAGAREVCVLKHHKGEVNSVNFSPDGRRLASGGFDGTILIVDARPWPADSRVEQEARGLVMSLFARPLLKAEVMARIRADRGIGEEVRRQALALADRQQDDAGRYKQACRDVVRHREAAPALFPKALGWAQTASRLSPKDGACLTALGLAQYRLSQYADALKTLTRAEALNQANPADQLADLAFLAMAHQRLGHKAEAARALGRLRDLMKQSRFSIDQEALAYLAEAEALLAP
jgi:hypothetical protein